MGELLRRTADGRQLTPLSQGPGKNRWLKVKSSMHNAGKTLLTRSAKSPADGLEAKSTGACFRISTQEGIVSILFDILQFHAIPTIPMFQNQPNIPRTYCTFVL